MNDAITPKQALVMWCLLGRHGEALQGEIVPQIKKADREALVTGGFITSEKEGQAFRLRIEDKGWRWANEHLRDELPAGFQVLQDWLTRLHQHLERNDQALADFIGPAPERAPAPVAEKQRPSRSGRVSRKLVEKRPKPPTALQLRERIETAYLLVTAGRRAEQALLSKVRAQLPDLSRDMVDKGLLRILQGDKQGKKKARLGQVSDPKALTQDDRDAAFSPGGEPFHLLWIQS
jgi:hypothetical protein